MEQTEIARGSRPAPLTLVAAVALGVGILIVGIAAPSTYGVYKMLHVVAAVVWVGGAAMIAVLALLTERENDPAGLAALGRKTEYLSNRFFIPSALAVLAFGIAMMLEGDLDWGQFWLIVGLVGFAVTFAVGIAYLGPQTKKVAALTEEHGPEHALTQAALKKLLVVVRFDVAMMLVIVADMAAKPFS